MTDPGATRVRAAQKPGDGLGRDTEVRMTASITGGRPPRHLQIRHRQVPVLLPSLRDARLKLSAVICSLQILGQTVLDFKVSIAQILVTIGFCAIVDIGVTLVRGGVLAWPASALLTGNSTAFILRAPGTEHGDWWTLNGIQWFLLAAAIALFTKHVVRVGGRHRFNPSNIGLVSVLLLVGPAHVFPQYLWWGTLQAPVIAALVVIVLGAAWVLRAVNMLEMTLAFLATFTVLVAGLALTGSSFVALWAPLPISGVAYWLHICTSPEVLIFAAFMMSDPASAARGRLARIIFGAATAMLAAVLMSFQPTEYGIKVAILAALTVACACVPSIERAAAKLVQKPSLEMRRPTELASRGLLTQRAATLIVALMAATAVVWTARLSSDRELVLIEQGLVEPSRGQ